MGRKNQIDLDHASYKIPLQFLHVLYTSDFLVDTTYLGITLTLLNACDAFQKYVVYEKLQTCCQLMGSKN